MRKVDPRWSMGFCVNPDACEYCGESGEVRICGCGLRCCESCWSEAYDCCPECADDLARDDYYDKKLMERMGK